MFHNKTFIDLFFLLTPNIIKQSLITHTPSQREQNSFGCHHGFELVEIYLIVSIHVRLNIVTVLGGPGYFITGQVDRMSTG